MTQAIKFVYQILTANRQPPFSPFVNGDFDADTSALERQIDQMVYSLYGLTPEEIAIVEGRDNNHDNQTSLKALAKE